VISVCLRSLADGSLELRHAIQDLSRVAIAGIRNQVDLRGMELYPLRPQWARKEREQSGG
jgi:hypothetical protein